MTLPLIYTLQNVDTTVKRKLIYIIKNQNTDREKVNDVIVQVKQAGGIQYAETKMIQYRDEAIQLLKKYPSSPALQAMEDLVNFVIDRRY